MDKVKLAIILIIAVAVITLAYMLLTTFIFKGSSAGYAGSNGGGLAIGGPGGCVSTSGNCPQPGSAGPGQYLSH